MLASSEAEARIGMGKLNVARNKLYPTLEFVMDLWTHSAEARRVL
jgi:hypothetical protein